MKKFIVYSAVGTLLMLSNSISITLVEDSSRLHLAQWSSDSSMFALAGDSEAAGDNGSSPGSDSGAGE